MRYFQLIAAIPLDLKRKALHSPVPGLLIALSEYIQLEDRTTVLTKFRCKNDYKLFIERLDTGPSALRAWKKHFPELPDWSNCFVDIYIYMSSEDYKLRQFSFKVMNGIINWPLMTKALSVLIQTQSNTLL